MWHFRGLQPEAAKGVTVQLNALFKRPVLCILIIEMCVLVTINNVWNTKGNKKCLRSCSVALGCEEIWVILMYILDISKA